MFHEFKINILARHLLRIKVQVDFSVVLDSCLHKEEGALESFSDGNHLSSCVAANHALIDVTSGDSDMNGWLYERIIVMVLLLLKPSEVTLDVERSEDGTRRVIVVAEEGAAPRSCDDQASFIGHDLGDCAFHAVDLGLYNLNDGLQESQLLFRRAFERFLVELDGHCKHCLLQVLSEGSRRFTVLRMGKMTERSGYVRLELHLNLLYLRGTTTRLGEFMSVGGTYSICCFLR